MAGIVERFGRYHRTLHAGLNMVTPFVDRLRPLIDLREQVVSFPPQPVITRDNLVVGIDTVIYFQVTDARAATYEVANYITAVEQLTVTTLRNVVGGMDLETALTSRDQINNELRRELDEATGRWGIRVGRVELKAIEPPSSIQDSMEKQMRADRDKRAAILSAEGSKQSAILTAEGERQAAVLGPAASPRRPCCGPRRTPRRRRRGPAGRPKPSPPCSGPSTRATRTSGLLAYQYMQMLPQIAQGDANKVWIVPSEIGKALEGIGGLLRQRAAGRAAAALGPAAPPGREARPAGRQHQPGPLRQGRGRVRPGPGRVTRVSKAGWRAVAGPCTTVPSATAKVEPCHGQATQAAPRSTTIRPWCSGPPRCEHRSDSTSPRRPAGTPAATGSRAGGGPGAGRVARRARTGRASPARTGG